jgi:sensor histidine kinase YesM
VDVHCFVKFDILFDLSSSIINHLFIRNKILWVFIFEVLPESKFVGRLITMFSLNLLYLMAREDGDF